MSLAVLPTDNDINYFLSQSNSETERIVAGMVSIIDANEDKLFAIQEQNWFQRIWFTVSGKNKATVKEMEQNRNKLAMYSIQIISKLIDEKRISDTIVSNLAIRINELFSSHLQLQNMVYEIVGKLNKKIESVDNYQNLITDVQNGKYALSKRRKCIFKRSEYIPKELFANLFEIFLLLDNRMISDKNLLIRLKETLEQHDYDFSQNINVNAFIEQIIALPEEKIGQIYLFAQNHSQYLYMQLTCCLIEQYHFAPKSNRNIVKAKAISSALNACGLNIDSPSCTVGELYEDICQSAAHKTVLLLKQISIKQPQKHTSSIPLIGDVLNRVRKNSSIDDAADDYTDDYDYDDEYDESDEGEKDEAIINILLKYFSGGWLYKLHCGYIDSILSNNALNNIVLKTDEFLLDSEKEIIGIIDTSGFENGKEGIVFTRNCVYFSETLSKPIRIFYETIKSVNCKKGLLGNKLLVERERWHGGNIEWFSTNAPKDKLAYALYDIANLFERGRLTDCVNRNKLHRK